MPNNPLTQQELYDYGILRSLTPSAEIVGALSPPYFPAGYFLVPPHDVNGPVLWRKFNAGYISEGIIDRNRLGTGSTGAGNLYLADDGTWKVVSSGTIPTLDQVTTAGNTTTNAITVGVINATLANVSTPNVVYYNTTNGLFTYGTAPVGIQFVIDYDYNIVGLKNGSNIVFTTSAVFIATTTRVYLNGQRLTRGVGYDYVETGTNQITFVNPPTSTDLIIIEYQI